MGRGRRVVRVVLGGALVVVVTALVLNVAGVLRYPGGPLIDLDSDPWFALDIPKPNQGTSWVGNEQPVDWATTGTEMVYGMLALSNDSQWTATIDAITPINPTPGFTLEDAYLLPADAPLGHDYAPVSIAYPDGVPATDWASLPTALPPSREDGRNPVVLIARSDKPGAFGFDGLVLDYHVGPFSFRATQHVALHGCLGPLPAGEICPALD